MGHVLEGCRAVKGTREHRTPRHRIRDDKMEDTRTGAGQMEDTGTGAGQEQDRSRTGKIKDRSKRIEKLKGK